MREQVAWAGLIATAGAFSNCASGQRGSGRVDPPALLHLLHLDHGLLFSGLSPHLICPSAPAIQSACPCPLSTVTLPSPSSNAPWPWPPWPPPTLLLIPAFGFLWFGHLLKFCIPIGIDTNAHFSTQTNWQYLILSRDAIKMKTWEKIPYFLLF